MTVRYITDGSSILDSPANILVAPVNCRAGVMGAGLAKAFAQRWPDLVDCHRRAVDFGSLSPGHGYLTWITDEPDRPDPFGVYLLPTKDDWRDPSKLEWVADGLDRLALDIDGMSGPEWGERRVKSVAIPGLGCGLGGLRWWAVRALILRTCECRPDVEWLVYPPKGMKS